MTQSILLVGVGGQGTILAGKLLTMGLLSMGHDVKMSEIHGMSQRGGAVSTHVRYGGTVYSPVIEKGGADALVAFERMEALRWLDYLKIDGVTLVNDHRINPMPVASGKTVYPAGIMDELRSRVKTVVLNAYDEARALGAGGERAFNVLMLGAAVRVMGLEGADWHAVIRDNVKPAYADINIKAFEKGGELAWAV